MIKHFIFCLFVGACPLVFSQWKESSVQEFTEEVLLSEKAIEGSYSYEMNYSFFNDLEAKDLEMEMKGFIYNENGIDLYVDQFGRFSYQNQILNVTVDTVLKYVIVQPAVKEFTKKKTLDELKPFLESKCIVHKQLKDKLTQYSIEFGPSFKYKGCEIWFNQQHYVVKMILFAGESIEDDRDFQNPKTIEPRLEIVYSNYLTGSSFRSVKGRKLENIISENGGVLSIIDPRFTSFELIDLRVKE